MSGLLHWIQGMQQPGGSAQPPQQPPPFSMPPGVPSQYHDALRNVYQKYAPGAATPPLQSPGGGGFPPGGMRPATPGMPGGIKPAYAPPPGASQNMNPSSIRVDFHAPESANPQ